MKTYDKMYCVVIKFGNSLGFTIPSNNVKFSGLIEGDILEVRYRKKDENESEKTGC